MISGILNSFLFVVLFFRFFYSDVYGYGYKSRDNSVGCKADPADFHGYCSNRYDNIYIRRSNARLQEAVYGGLFGKTVGMDMKTMASPDYNDLFQFVLHQSADAMLFALDMIFSYMSNIILLFLNGCLLFTYEPIYFLLC